MAKLLQLLSTRASGLIGAILAAIGGGTLYSMTGQPAPASAPSGTDDPLLALIVAIVGALLAYWGNRGKPTPVEAPPKP